MKNLIQRIMRDPKTSLAGISALLITLANVAFPQYRDALSAVAGGIASLGLLLAKDSDVE